MASGIGRICELHAAPENVSNVSPGKLAAVLFLDALHVDAVHAPELENVATPSRANMR